MTQLVYTNDEVRLIGKGKNYLRAVRSLLKGFDDYFRETEPSPELLKAVYELSKGGNAYDGFNPNLPEASFTLEKL